MLTVHKVRQPRSFDRFQCTGAACPDTCCVGWGILVDQRTYDKYQQDPDLRVGDRPVSDLVEINPAGSSASDYAKFRLTEAGCPALQGGLCSIQQAYGEPNIPDLCSSYPRVLTEIGGTIERSLHLSCPEAARLVLTNPDALWIEERTEEHQPYRAGSINAISGDPKGSLNAVRAFVIEIIRERSLPLWQRIVSLGFVIDRLADIDIDSAAPTLEEHVNHIRKGSFAALLNGLKPDPSFQLETVLELVVARIGSDYTAPRFVECYSDFMVGLNWTAQSSMQELASRYSVAAEQYLRPFLLSHEYLLENYLINYIFRTVFPYRRKLPNQKFAIDSSRESLNSAFVSLCVHYAIVRTLLVGIAALHRSELNEGHAIKLVQSYSKAFLHSGTFEKSALDYLEKYTSNPAAAALLVRD